MATPATLYTSNMVAAMLGALGVVVGSLGPWGVLGPFGDSAAATGGDGTLTLGLGLAAACCLFANLNGVRIGARGFWVPALGLIAGALGLLAFIFAVVDVYQISSRKTEVFGMVVGFEVGWGLWLVLISALVLAFTAVIAAFQASKMQS